MVRKVADFVREQLRAIEQYLLASLHKGAASKEVGGPLVHHQTEREGNSEVVCETLYSGDSGGGRS